MKKIIALALSIIMLLSMTACGTETSEPEITEPPSTLSLDDSSVLIGNLVFEVPDRLSAKNLSGSDNSTITYIFSSADSKFTITAIAMDVSDLNEDTCKILVPSLLETIQDDSFTYMEKDPIDATIGGFNVAFSTYLEISEKSDVNVLLGTAFTDSWYTYTIYIRETPGDTDYSEEFADFISSAKFVGETPRFSYVQ